MCGRYALALRPGQIRQRLEDDNMPVYGGLGVDDDNDNSDGPGAPRQSYNFAPGYHGVVYRADVPDWGAGPRRGGRGGARDEHQEDGNNDDEHQHDDNEKDNADGHRAAADDDATAGDGKVRYMMQSMKWGLVPFWTKRNPDYGSMLKTINCRDDSLAQAGGMWASMKARKRCIVVAQGFYEWLKKDGVKDKIPHYIKRKDGKLMCMAGLWDVVQYEDDDYKHYTYTIITTDSNKQLGFLHDRMPVILENGSAEIRTWLDPARHEWSGELQSLLRPWSGELEIYPVSKDVGKVGNNSPTFIIPLDSKENKNNIANFFTNKGAASQKKEAKSTPVKTEAKTSQPIIEMSQDMGFVAEGDDKAAKEETQSSPNVKTEPSSQPSTTSPTKRRAPHGETNKNAEPPAKKEKLDHPPPASTRTTRSTASATKETAPSSTSPQKQPAPGGGPAAGGRPKISATSNGTKSPAKGKNPGTQKITKFFGNSA